MQNINWKKLFGVSEYSSLHELGFDPIEITPNFYQIADSVFAHAVKDYKGETVGGPFVSQFYWAPSVGAARRVILREIEADDMVTGEPPAELLLDRKSKTFGELLMLAKSGQNGEFRSGFNYRSDGKCMGRYIYCGKQTFYFRTCKVHGDDEPLFSISIDLRRIRWAKAG